MTATERDGLVILEHDGHTYGIERSYLDAYVLYPERIRLIPNTGEGPTIHGQPDNARHVAHDSGKGVAIASIDGVIEAGRLAATRVLYADGTQCFAGYCPRKLETLD